MQALAAQERQRGLLTAPPAGTAAAGASPSAHRATLWLRHHCQEQSQPHHHGGNAPSGPCQPQDQWHTCSVPELELAAEISSFCLLLVGARSSGHGPTQGLSEGVLGLFPAWPVSFLTFPSCDHEQGEHMEPAFSVPSSRTRQYMTSFRLNMDTLGITQLPASCRNPWWFLS